MKISVVFLSIAVLTMSCSKNKEIITITSIPHKFIAVNLPDTLPLNNLQFYTPEKGIISTNTGLFLKTKNSGDSWEIYTANNCSTVLTQFFMASDTLGLFCDANYHIYRYNGHDYSNFNFPVKNSALADVQFLTKQLWFAATKQNPEGFSYLLKTNNAGNTWDTLSFIYQADYAQIVMMDEYTGIVIGNANGKAYLKKTTDGGKNWVDKISPELGQLYNQNLRLNKIIILDHQNIIIVGRGKQSSEGIILTSIDAGESWNYSLPFYALNDCAATSTNIYFAGDALFVAQWKINTNDLSASNNIINQWKTFNKDADFLRSNNPDDQVNNFDNISQICFPNDGIGFILSTQSNRLFRLVLEP